ncbi:hypothetical protein QQX98_012733 [Neonectria punicea]|uniref:Transcription factor domain-containing protein n=1 Tax=Neonectria punicea TaxID=979145 RepID=A0ABR1GI04_9HYPO
MLSREDTARLVERYFDFAVPVDRFLHQPTVKSWLEEFYATMGDMHDKREAPARTAVLFMLFALAQEHMVPKPTPVGADMSTRLSRILSGILRDIYSIKPISNSDCFALTAKYTEDLNGWRMDMSPFLDADGINTAPLVPIFQRQRNVLNLAYWHTLILTHRPLLLSNFARLRSGRRRGREYRECLQAAMSIVGTVDDIIQARQLFQAFWFKPYFAFSASVILYVYTIQQSNEAEETYRPYFVAAERCQNQMASIAEPGSLTSSYCLVLEELRTEVSRQTENPDKSRSQPVKNGSVLGTMVSEADAGLSLTGDPQLPTVTLEVPEFGTTEELDFNVSPSDSLADLTSWGQFDSMVMSGFPGA